MPGRSLPNLGLTGFWPLGEDGWNDANDANLLALSVLVQGGVINKVAVLPTDPAPAAGDAYILDETDATNPNQIAVFDDGGWKYLPAPKEGWLIYNRTADYYEKFDGTVWAELVTGGGGGLADAPSDGTIYGRQDGAWVEAGGGGGAVATNWTKAGSYTLSGSETIVPIPSSKHVRVFVRDAVLSTSGRPRVNLRAGAANVSFIENTFSNAASDSVTEPGDADLFLGGANTTGQTSATIDIFAPREAAEQTHVDTYSWGGGSAARRLGVGGAADHNELRFFPSGGTFSSGTVEVWYLNASAAPEAPTVIEKTGTAELLSAADANTYARYTNAAAKTLTVQAEATAALPANGEWHLRNAGAGNLTVVPDSGVTINAPAGGTLVIPERGTATLKRVAADLFDLMGYTVAA